MVKEDYKSKLDGNELDLSLMSLEEIPVKEIVAIPKATHIDLSCNRITIIPSTFCNLKNLVKLDLSRNSIESLPKNFGDLSKLQYLDLLNNKLSVLPLSFGQLKQLKWLDLKGNPLTPHLRKVAGDCSDEKQCQICARKVVQYMEILYNEMLIEKEKQKKEKELAAQRKMQEEKAQEQQRKAKKAAKEKKKASPQVEKRKQHQQQNQQQHQQQSSNHKLNSKSNQNGPSSKQNKKGKNTSKNGNRGFVSSVIKILGFLITLSVFIFGVLYFYTKGDFSEESILRALVEMKSDAILLISQLSELILKTFAWILKEGKPFFDIAIQYVIILLKDVGSILSHTWSHLSNTALTLLTSLQGT